MYASPIRELIRSLSRLPGVGNKTAERYAFYLLKSGKGEVRSLMRSLEMLMEKIKSCALCLNFSDQSPCAICADNKRHPHILCVVAEPQDIEVFESTKAFNGRYFLLRGTVDPDDDESIRRLPIETLLQRIEENGIKEILLGLNHDMRGETTSLYIQQTIQKKYPAVRITRLARGLAMGSDVQYADTITLGSAITHRTEMKDA